jgi:hypothetical protein
VDDCKPPVILHRPMVNVHRHTLPLMPILVQSISSPSSLYTSRPTITQGLTLVHFSTQPQPVLVTDATTIVQFPAQPEMFLWIKLPE